MKNYKDWLAEDARHFSPAVSAELVIGNYMTPVDPQSENWIAQTARLSEYLSFAKDVKKALKAEDDTSIRSCIKTAKSLPLFRTEPETVWKKSQIDGVEQFRSDAEFRRWIARYILSKVTAFKEWCKNDTQPANASQQ